MSTVFVAASILTQLKWTSHIVCPYAHATLCTNRLVNYSWRVLHSG